MKSISALAAVASAAVLLSGCQEKADLKTNDQKFSYGLGANIGSNMKQQGLALDQAAFTAGFHDGQSGAKLQIEPEAIQAALQAKQKEMMAKREQESKAAADKNLAASEAFLSANKSKPGVQTTASGLQYKVIKPGSGKKPTSGTVVSVNYKGTLVDGTEFDSTKPDAPASLPIDGVIPGWTEGLQLMSEGATYEFYIPASLAYGPQGAGGGRIPGNAALIFQVDLVKVLPASAAPKH